jgi:hypothetical protein
MTAVAAARPQRRHGPVAARQRARRDRPVVQNWSTNRAIPPTPEGLYRERPRRKAHLTDRLSNAGGLSLGFAGEDEVIILVNNDDDNNNDLPDDEESGAISGENDLVPMTIQVNLASTCPNVTLSLASGAARVWSSPQRDAGGPLIGDGTTSKTWTIGQQPSTVYIEPLAGSTTVGGLAFTLAGGDTQARHRRPRSGFRSDIPPTAMTSRRRKRTYWLGR